MNIQIVTGAAGFIGSHLAETLLKQGSEVIGIDQFNDYYDLQIKQNNVANLKQYPGFKLIKANIQDLDWQKLLQSVEVVYHQAAQAGVRSSWGQDFHHYTERNINATQVILEGAKQVKSLKRIVYASSSSIYGDAVTMPTPETLCPKPVSPYGITKLAGERLCWLYQHNFGVPVTSLRYFTVYGPRQRPDMAFHKFFKAAINNEAISIYGDGQQTRDYTYVSDAVAANLAAGEVPEAIGEVFNVGGGSRVTLMELLDIMEQVTGHPIKKDYTNNAAGDARHTSADVTKAQKLLNYIPQVSLQEGLAQEWQWMQSLYA
ncbi:GDP-mannose 4,6-dehydratase [Waterburya agarophytonicola K14]|uniref:GDP-mannose 4,6-dehydratase n=1 Tax=Waterburya agarophytonicola KI4 TaxID=2874699 RepID=A0A964BQR4_9CYAN|nr:NAD-dependent epimerase/dehydratase family protein [Waterburya agarophytonicola]MCC0177126.1 GDP-mannose 4,6-dehydratase [Waterburya agarophytonicola KI4]